MPTLSSIRERAALALCLFLGSVACTGGASPGPDRSAQTARLPSDCAAAERTTERVVCLAAAFRDALPASLRDTLQMPLTEANAARWSNLPATFAPRNGVRLGSLSEGQRTLALQVVQAAMSAAGFTTFEGVRAADEELAVVQGGGAGAAPGGPPGGPPGRGGGGGPGRLQFGAGLYFIAFLGEPSTADPWILQVGGHHYAIQLSFEGGLVSATPNFIGVEPVTFALNGQEYAPMADKAASAAAMLDALSPEQLASARLSASFDDVLLGPRTNGAFPDPQGLRVGTLGATQRERVADAIEAWVGVLPEGEAAEVMADYLGADALSATYVAWSSGPDLDAPGSYVRIAGPRVWIEIVAQRGVVLRDQIHYHSVWRDQELDYGGFLGF